MNEHDERKLIEIARTCPAVNWKKHTFSVGLMLANKRHIVARFELPVDDQEPFTFTQHTVEERFGDEILADRQVLLSPEDYEEICEAIADVLNKKMEIVQRDVSEHLLLTAGVLQALMEEKWLAAYVLLTHLGDRLMTYVGELWVYEWPEWVTSVELFLGEHLSEEDKQVLRKLL
jgi:hypothetical protein